MNIRSTVEPAPGRSLDARVADIADVFGLLADPGRLRLLISLQGGEASAGQLAERSGLSRSAASHALRLLRAHEVVEVRRSGRMAFYRLADQHVRELIASALGHSEHSSPSHPERGSGIRAVAADHDAAGSP